MSNIAIQVEDLGKRYRIGEQRRSRAFRNGLMNVLRSPLRALRPNGTFSSSDYDNTIWALKNVSFKVEKGEVVGIIGRNGAGKSTLLKILSFITEPTEGYAKVYGRVGSLLEVGTGFHPELTGRENIYLNAAILGMKRKEIDKKFDEIVAFAEVEKFIATPVKHYSSGMYMRLAFSVAAHLNPEILLVDEVLAVGDAAFQKKCLGKMQNVADEGRTVLFVSHNVEVIQRLCGRCLWLGDGKVVLDRDADFVTCEYLKQSFGDVKSYYKVSDFQESDPPHKARLIEAEILNAGGVRCDHLRFGETFAIRMLWEHRSEIPGLAYAIRVRDENNRLIFAANTLNTSLRIEERGIQDVLCRFDQNILIPGEYYVSIGSYVRPHTSVHVVEPCLKLVVLNAPYHSGHTFNIVDRPLVDVVADWCKKNSASHDGRT